MEVKKEDISRIKSAFEKMQTKGDLLALLNSAKPFVYGPRTVLFELRQLSWYASPKLSRERYKEFKIKKKSGQERAIHAPVKGLKAIQRTLAFILQCVFEPHRAVTGFVRGRSIIDNAQAHAGNRYVYNIDLKDFFPSIDQARVWKCLQLRPFDLTNEKAPRRLELANIIASLCCAEMDVERMNEGGEWTAVKKYVLPQGAPTSPVLSNIICQRLDYLLSAVAKRFGMRYTRYADDITFSSMHNVYREDHGFMKELHRIIADQRFYIRESKTRLQKEGYRQEVTGLLVNKKVNVQKKYIKELRMWLNYWERYDYIRAAAFFSRQHGGRERHFNGKEPNMKEVIAGKLDFLQMVKGKEDNVYLGLKDRYDTLTKSTVEGQQENRKNTTQGLSKPILPHDPVYTVKFLKNFKIGDGSGFKELVHDTELSGETIGEILNKVKSNPNFIYRYKGETVKNISFLNPKLHGAVTALIDNFEQEGVPYFERTGRHPYNNDETYTNFARNFKRNYRYGSGEEYSKFLIDLTKIFEEQGLPKEMLIIEPDIRKFNIRATFFTWKPSLLTGIKYLVQGIRDHLNINGERISDFSNKKISIEAVKVEADDTYYTELRILDQFSKVSVDGYTLWKYLINSTAYLRDFRNLCDWIVECDFVDDEPSCRFNLLTAKSAHSDQNEINPLDHPVGGYKNILRFYESR